MIRPLRSIRLGPPLAFAVLTSVVGKALEARATALPDTGLFAPVAAQLRDRLARLAALPAKDAAAPEPSSCWTPGSPRRRRASRGGPRTRTQRRESPGRTS